jgi:hypothetical protein
MFRGNGGEAIALTYSQMGEANAWTFWHAKIKMQLPSYFNGAIIG